MNAPKDAWREALQKARRAEQVSDLEHQAIVAAVRAEARSRPAARPRPQQQWAWLAVPASACALALALLVDRSAAPPAPDLTPPELRFAQLLDQRLSEPVRQLAVIPEVEPLAAELAALEKDLRRLRPVLPWSSLLNPAPAESG